MRTIRKKDIFFRNTGIIIFFITIVLLLLFIWIYTFTKPIEPSELKDIKAVTIYIIVGFILIYAYYTIPRYLKLRTMEKALNIDFDEEMKKLKVDRFYFQNDDWFIYNRAFIINRKYIKYIKSAKEHYGEGNVSGGYYYVYKIVTIKDKTVRHIEWDRDDKFTTWYNR